MPLNENNKCDILIVYACISGNLDLIIYLYSCGLNIRYDNDLALQHAVKNNHIEIIIYLLDNGANPYNGEEAYDVNPYNGEEAYDVSPYNELSVYNALYEAVRNNHI
ncbi:MAG: ankyrin repeat protein [Rickettsiales bacterium]|nr:MAG: ankyrin repeat protein [Rickettsiales bacterium]